MIFLGLPETMPICPRVWNWQMSVFHWLSSSHLFAFRGPCYSSRYHNIEIRPMIKATMVSKCLSKRKSCVSLILNQQLEKVAHLVKKVGETSKLARCWVSCTKRLAMLWKQSRKLLNEMKRVARVRMHMGKQSRLTAPGFSSLDRRSSQPQHSIKLELIQSKAPTIYI